MAPREAASREAFTRSVPMAPTQPEREPRAGCGIAGRSSAWLAIETHPGVRAITYPLVVREHDEVSQNRSSTAATPERGCRVRMRAWTRSGLHAAVAARCGLRAILGLGTTILSARRRGGRVARSTARSRESRWRRSGGRTRRERRGRSRPERHEGLVPRSQPCVRAGVLLRNELGSISSAAGAEDRSCHDRPSAAESRAGGTQPARSPWRRSLQVPRRRSRGPSAS